MTLSDLKTFLKGLTCKCSCHDNQHYWGQNCGKCFNYPDNVIFDKMTEDEARKDELVRDEADRFIKEAFLPDYYPEESNDENTDKLGS